MNPIALLKPLSTLKKFLSPAELIRIQDRSSLTDPYSEYYRACKELISELTLEICVRYDFSVFRETGAHNYVIELFSWGTF